ncbi:MAG: VOC family protein [Chloroflexi bacterium]|nr:VOC family protein [Chloroflexota bacterium]
MTQAQSSTPDISDLPDWRGFHHVALMTPDLDATMRFYGDLLGMQVGPILQGAGGQGRHCFIRPGATEAWGLHFFEHPDAQVFAYPQNFPRFAVLPGALQHIAFTLPDEVAALTLRQRLAAFGVAMTDIAQIGPISNTLFRDNNGLLLEATWPRDVEA